ADLHDPLHHHLHPVPAARYLRAEGPGGGGLSHARSFPCILETILRGGPEGQRASGRPLHAKGRGMSGSFIARNPSVLWFLAGLAVFTVAATIMSQMGLGIISTSFVKTLGKT